MVVYRITDSNYASDLSGRGSALYGGRWNNKDTYMVYTAQSRSLALLEVVVHIGRIPNTGHSLTTIEIPDNSITSIPLENLPPGWHISPAPNYLKQIGDQFIKSNQFLALKVPSVLMMEEHSYLINPLHPLFRSVRILSERPLKLDERLMVL